MSSLRNADEDGKLINENGAWKCSLCGYEGKNPCCQGCGAFMVNHEEAAEAA